MLLTLIFLAKVSLSYRNPVKVILLLQIFFWGVSFVGRPLILLIVQPSPKLDDSIADPRLAALGYDYSISLVLQPILFGLVSYALLAWAMRRKANAWLAKLDHSSDESQSQHTWLFAAFFLGWASRIAWLLIEKDTFASAVAETLSWVALVALAGLIKTYLSMNKEKFHIIAALGSGELIWSFLFSSKTPIVGFATLCIVMLASGGWTLRRVRFIAAVGVSTLASFPVIQALKFSEVTDKIAAADSTYPLIIQPLMPFLRRFDLLSAVTDATFFSASSWLTYLEYSRYVFQNLIPQQLIGIAKSGAGSSWAVDVRSSSTGIQNFGVSLAEGFIGEGYLLGGFIGVALLAILLFGSVLIIATHTTSNKPFLFSIAAIGLSFPVLFERGFLGFTEVFGKSLQVAIIVLVLKWLVELPSSRRRVDHVASKTEYFR